MLHAAKRLIPQAVKRAVQLLRHRHDLPWLAEYFGTDKWGVHRYAAHYQRHFKHLQAQPINLLEIGVGGHDNPRAGGASLRMWKAFFPKAKIFGLDLFDKSALQEDRITIFQGSQADPDCLRRVAAAIGRLDVVIDDGSHVNRHVLSTAETLLPFMHRDSLYAIEDLHTAYWPQFGGGPPGSSATSIAWLKERLDGLNWEEIPGHVANPHDRAITAIHCYRNLAILEFGENVQGSTRQRDHVVHDRD